MIITFGSAVLPLCIDVDDYMQGVRQLDFIWVKDISYTYLYFIKNKLDKNLQTRVPYTISEHTKQHFSIVNGMKIIDGSLTNTTHKMTIIKTHILLIKYLGNIP